jgi:hypothetical protein
MPRSAVQVKPQTGKAAAGAKLRAVGRLISGHMPVFWAAYLTILIVAAHAGKYPHFAGFFAGVDQQRYLRAAQAWGSLNLDPSRHHYLPLYPLMAAPFVWLTPWQPFFVPDLLCALVAFFAFLAVARRLAPGWTDAVPAICFVLSLTATKQLLGLWIVPWSSTGAAPFQMLALLFALRFAEAPTIRRAAAIGAAVGIIAGFRPSDAAVLLAVCIPFAGFVLAAGRQNAYMWPAFAASGAGGLVGVVAAIAALHALIFGFAPGPYLAESASIGFEWRLVPLRWVMLVLGPVPLLPEGQGIATRLMFVLPGLAGLLFVLSKRRSADRLASWGTGKPAACLVGCTVALHWATYLAYRDMHPYGLWRFNNIHYFKWTFPFLMLWAAQLFAGLRPRETRRRALLAMAAITPLVCWRPSLRKPTAIASAVSGQTLILPHAPSLTEALFLPLAMPASGLSWSRIYFAHTDLIAGQRDYITKRDTKLLPVPGGALFIVLRETAQGPATLQMPADVKLATDRPPVLYRQALIFGLPCGWFTGKTGCAWSGLQAPLQTTGTSSPGSRQR